MGGERKSKKSDRLKYVLISSQNYTYRADIELRKGWNYAISPKKMEKVTEI